MSEFSIRNSMVNLPSMQIDKSAASEKLSSPGLGAPATGSSSGGSFVDSLKNALSNVNESMTTADKAAQKFATGKAENLHDVMIAMEKADLSLRTLTAVRGKLVEAYHEIMKMPV